MGLQRTNAPRTAAKTGTWVGASKAARSPQATPAPLMSFQRAIGNQAFSRLLQSGAIQAKLTVGPQNDAFEQEANRVAENVNKPAPAGVPHMPTQSMVQRKGTGDATPHDASDIESTLRSASRGGRPLDPDIRADMERRIGADFSGVKVHTDDSATQMNRELNAQAFTHGSDIYFGQAKYDPNSSSGRRLIAHELAHVVQQGASPARDVVRRMPGGTPEEKKVRFLIHFDKPMTAAEMTDLAENTIYGRRINLTWTWGQAKYSAADSPVGASVPVSTLQARLKDYGEGAAKSVQGIDSVQDAATYQRLNRVLQKLTPAQWADFEKKITGQTTDLDAFEAAVNAYLAANQQRETERGERERLTLKLFGLEAVYKRYKDYVLLVLKRGSAPEEEKALTDLLQKYGFSGGIPEFQKFIQDYLQAFRTETVKIGLDLLQQYDSVLYKEGLRYQDPAVVGSLYTKLAPLRKEFPEFEKDAKVYNDYVRDEPLSRLPGNGGILKSTREEAMAAGERAKQHKAAAQQSVAGISEEFPILKEDELPLDRRLDKAAMAKADQPQLMALLQDHIRVRREDIKKTRDTLTNDPDKIFSLDNLFNLSLKRQNIDSKSIFGEIIQDKVSAIRIIDAAIGIAIAVFAIALTIVSFGTGALAVGAAVAAFGISAVTAYQEFKDYETKHAAAGAGLLSEDPSLVWVVIAVAGAAVDGAQALKALKAISPLAKAVEGTQDLAKFSEGLKALQEAGEIDVKIAKSADQAALAHAKALEASKGLSKALGKAYSFPGPFTDPEVYKELVKLAFYKVKEAGFAFEKFALEIKEARNAAKLGDLTTEELTQLKRAYSEGKAFTTEEELAKYLKQTHPMGSVDPAAVPQGKRTKIRPQDDAETTRSLQRENDAADILSKKGYKVEQNPKVSGPSNPDYLVEGKVFDNYAPTEKKTARGIWSYIKEEKLDKGQTTRVILNLQDWGGDLAALKKQFADWPMAGLDEVIVILKDKTVLHLVP